jgi:hypothetical protein
VNGELAELKQLADFVLEVNFPHLLAHHADSREVRTPSKVFVKNIKIDSRMFSSEKKRGEKFWTF